MASNRFLFASTVDKMFPEQISLPVVKGTLPDLIFGEIIELGLQKTVLGVGPNKPEVMAVRGMVGWILVHVVIIMFVQISAWTRIVHRVDKRPRSKASANSSE